MALDESAGFDELMEGIRHGDAYAAELLVRRYEPEIRREVRLRLRGRDLRRLLDTMDITQSILGNFFIRAAHGEFEIEGPGQLLALLSRMARNRIVDWSRNLSTKKRDTSREKELDALPPDTDALAGRGPSASAYVRAQELLEKFRSSLPADLLEVAEKKAHGWTWPEIGRHVGEDPDALRKRWERAREKIVGEMHLD